MTTRSVDMKASVKVALKKQGLSEAMIADMAKSIDDGHSSATTRLAEIEAQIAQLENDRAHWLEMQSGYASALDGAAVVTIEESINAEPEGEAASEAETKSDDNKT